MRVVGKVDKIRRSLVYASAYVESQVDGGRVADATATLVAADARVELPAQSD